MTSQTPPIEFPRVVTDEKEFARDKHSLYGAASIAARYCGFGFAYALYPGRWQHGWAAPHRRQTPEYEFGEDKLSPKMNLWVAREDQAEFLRSSGYPKARAIGLPCVYIPRTEVKRIPNSLLVVPSHSLDYTRHDWKFDEYADYIDQLKQDFDTVAVIIHKSCISNGYWINEFQSRGIPVYEGAHTSDPTSLYRQAALFSAFEYTTTNTIGSHVVYAALWGSKTSLCGAYAKLNAEDYVDTPFYQQFPELLEPALEGVSEETTRRHFPELFVSHPRDASTRIEWAEGQVGADCKISPAELRKAFGWGEMGLAIRKCKVTIRAAVNPWLPKPIRI